MEETETVLTLADFGALLRERRIHKGLTEENVAAQLKITSRLVKAIEEGDMESMPHAVYARGFIRAYAKLLAVDDSVTHVACALLKDPEEELREQEIRVVPAAARREESHVPWLAILLCALFLAGGAWYFRDSIPGLSSNRPAPSTTYGDRRREEPLALSASRFQREEGFHPKQSVPLMPQEAWRSQPAPQGWQAS